MAITLVACRVNTDKNSPFGIWSTGRGQEIEVRRDGVYKYCDSGTCQEGKYKTDGPKEVLLLGFAGMPITQHLRQLSGEDEAATIDVLTPMTSERRSSFELGDGGMSPEFRHRLCQDRPCRIIGRAEGDVVRFIKVRDF